MWVLEPDCLDSNLSSATISRVALDNHLTLPGGSVSLSVKWGITLPARLLGREVSIVHAHVGPSE